MSYILLASVGVLRHVYYAILAKYKSWIVSISFQYCTFAGDASKMITTCAPGNGVCSHMNGRTWSTDIFMAMADCFILLWVVNVSFAKWFRANFANNWTVVMNPTNMLIQIIFRSNWFPTLTRMTAFLANCKLLSRKDFQIMWCNHTRHTINFCVDVFLVGCVGEAGRKYWFDGAAQMSLFDGWTSRDIINNHWYVPVEVLPASGSDSTIAAVVFGCTVPVALLCPKIYSRWCWYHTWRHRMIFLRSPAAPLPGPWLVKHP